MHLDARELRKTRRKLPPNPFAQPLQGWGGQPIDLVKAPVIKLLADMLQLGLKVTEFLDEPDFRVRFTIEPYHRAE